jgi:hypothetical protein
MIWTWHVKELERVQIVDIRNEVPTNQCLKLMAYQRVRDTSGVIF